MIIRKVGLKLTSGNPGDLVQVRLFNSSGVQVGTAIFTGGSTVATSTLTTTLVANAVKQTTLIVKADIAAIGIGQPATPGDLVQVNVLNYEATGNVSGTTYAGRA
jgi:hypothetical protein